MITIGIDIGLTGALAAVDASGSATVHDLPTTTDGDKRICARSLILLIRQFVPAGQSALVIFEDVRPRSFGNGGKQTNSMHSQGSMMRSRGIVEAVASIARLEVKTVQPQTWKRFYGLLKTEKRASLEKARTIFPTIAHDLKRVKDHNRAESLLLAHWGQKEFA
jgi:hypothetical protein